MRRATASSSGDPRRQGRPGLRRGDRDPRLRGDLRGVVQTDAPSCLVLAALGLYGIASGAAGYAVWPRSYRVTRHADVLWRNYWDAPPRTIKEAMVTDAAGSYRHNGDLLRRKRPALVVALGATAFEAAAVVFAFAW